MKFELDEILWEFTLKCNKNCQYCGSKNILNKEEKSKYKKEEIAKYITKVKPKSITITGGEPSCELKELIKCVDILYKSKIEVKILTNGHLFDDKDYDNWFSFNEKIKTYGLSINNWQDIQLAKDNRYDKYADKTTIITNFGIHNLDYFDDIAKYAIQFPCWQVQLTMGNELQLDFNKIRELNEKINKIKNSGICNIIKADNFNYCKCMAGIKGFSITYDGKIIPCLSYRAWKSDLLIQGEVKDIVKIWKDGFKFNRNREFVPCCQDITGIRQVDYSNYYDLLKQNPPPSFPTESPNTKEVFVYGVVTPKPSDYNHIVTYGVINTDDISKNNITDDLNTGNDIK